MNILILNQDTLLRDRIELVLEKDEAFNITITDSLMYAIDTIMDLKEINLIFLGSGIINDKEPSELKSLIEEKVSSQKTLVIGTNKNFKNFLAENFIHPLSSSNIIIAKIEQFIEKLNTQKNQQKYFPVNLKLMFKINTYPCDFFIKIKGESILFKKRFLKDSDIDQKDLVNYRDKGLKYLYIGVGDKELFKNFYISKSKQENSEIRMEPSPDELELYSEIMDEVFEFTDYVKEEMGLGKLDSSEAMRVSKEINEQIQKLSSSKRKDVLRVVQQSFLSEDSFDIKVSTLTSILATSAVKYFDWFEPKMIDLIVYASQFQNISLKGDTQLIKVITQEELYSISSTDQARLIAHASVAADFADENDFIPKGVSTLIRESHGSLEGRNFPEKCKHSSELSALFRVCSDLITQGLKDFQANPIEANPSKTLVNEFKRNGMRDKKIFTVLQKVIPEV